ncbi:hypothetical protein SJAG_06639, partial [Schizosaccharomyces japonicus yFS275]
ISSSNESERAQRRRRNACFRCGQVGHYSRICPHRRRPQAGNVPIQYVCLPMPMPGYPSFGYGAYPSAPAPAPAAFPAAFPMMGQNPGANLDSHSNRSGNNYYSPCGPGFRPPSPPELEKPMFCGSLVSSPITESPTVRLVLKLRIR